MGHVCEVCGQMLDTGDALYAHFRAAHYEPDSVHCPFCDLAGVSVNEMQTHIEFVHPDPSTDRIATFVRKTASISQPQSAGSSSKKLGYPTDLATIGGDTSLQSHVEGSGKVFKGGTTAFPASRPSGAGIGLPKQHATVPEIDLDDGKTCTVGAIDQVRAWLTHSGCLIGNVATAPSHKAAGGAGGNGVRGGSTSSSSTVWLCTAGDHYAAGKTDAGWGCGYRNTQMLVSALIRGAAYANVLFEGLRVVPSIREIQKLIERAWKDGFDPDGALQLGGRLVATRKWIGASDIWAFFTSLRVKCQLVDFHRPSGPGSTHPLLLDWVRTYFQKKQDFTAPIYLQHQGHSRTIIGYEVTAQGAGRLLLFDPSNRARTGTQPLSASALFKRCSLQDLQSDQYQLLAVVGVLSEEERNGSKVIRSTRVP